MKITPRRIAAAMSKTDHTKYLEQPGLADPTRTPTLENYFIASTKQKPTNSIPRQTPDKDIWQPKDAV